MRRLKQFIWFMRALMAGRMVQDFLYGHVPGDRPNENYGAWVAVIEKRITKLNEVKLGRPGWKIEARKRLLQVATVAVAMIEWIDQLPNDYTEE